MPEQPEKMDLTSMNISAENRARLKQLFPSVLAETTNDKGELVESIDFEKLKAELGTFSDVFENRRERYGMDWPGKKDCMKLIQQPSIATLKPCREESVNFDDTENMFIEGDNLEVLKLLQKSYYGKVKMIYIDPPYNTGKEFIYPDKYSESLDTYLSYAGLVDDEGKKFSTNTPAEGRFHTKWLNMMYPRLYLARNLLREDGVIFISIGEDEVTNLRILMNDIFGEENFICSVIWEKADSPRNSARQFSEDHDFVLIYSKNTDWVPNRLPRTEEANSIYSNPDNDPNGPWLPGDPFANKPYSKGLFTVKGPTGRSFSPPPGRFWRISEEKLWELDAQERIWWGPTGNARPSIKRYLSEVGDLVPRTLWKKEDVGSNRTSKNEMRNLFPNDESFDTPKPTLLIDRMLQLVKSNTNEDIILDFFAGSSTTAHAIYDLNTKDNCNRKFIMVQLPEPTETANYKTIADIGKERIRRVIKKIEEEQAEKAKEAENQLPGMAEPPLKLDLGFKVLKLDRSNFKIWDGSDPEASEEKIAEQLDLFVEHIDPKSTQEDILYEILLKAGFMPTEKVEKLDLAGKTVFSISDGALLICLEDEITRELIDAVAETEPMRFICLDRGFQNNDQLKANAVQTFAARNQGREKAEQIIFRTV